jgi:hypothetical protein
MKTAKTSQDLLDEQAALNREIEQTVIDGVQAQPRITLSADQLSARDLSASDRMAVVHLAQKTGSSYQQTIQRLFRSVLVQAEAELKGK